jgi:hypothetical protein
MNWERKGYSAIHHIRMSMNCFVECNWCLQQLDPSQRLRELQHYLYMQQNA